MHGLHFFSRETRLQPSLSRPWSSGTRRPSVLSRATVPSGPPAAAAPAPAGGDTAVAVVVKERKIIAERPAPATFVEIANVKPIYFDFDRYDIRPEDARTLEADAAWLKSNKVLILVEGQCDERGTDEYNLTSLSP